MLKAQINNLMTPFKDVLIQIFGQDGVDALLEISTSDELAAWLNNTVDHDSLIFTKMAALNSNPEHKDTLIKFINFILQSVNPVNQYVKYTTILELLKLLPEQEIVKNLFKTRGKKGEEYRLIEYPNIALEINFFDENDLAIIFIKNLIKQDKIKKSQHIF